MVTPVIRTIVYILLGNSNKKKKLLQYMEVVTRPFKTQYPRIMSNHEILLLSFLVSV